MVMDTKELKFMLSSLCYVEVILIMTLVCPGLGSVLD